MKLRLFKSLLFSLSIVLGLVFFAKPAFACNFAAGEKWCGNCGYTCIQGWQSCPGTSQCGGGGDVDLRTVAPDTNTGGGGGIVPADGSNPDSGWVQVSAPAPTPISTTAPASSSTCNTTTSFCGGAGNLYSCTNILIGSRCDIRCSTGVSHDCAVKAGRPELGEGVTGPGLIYYDGKASGVPCRTDDQGCNGTTEMRIACTFPVGAYTCINRQELVDAQLTGSTATDVIPFNNLFTGLQKTCGIDGVCSYQPPSGTTEDLHLFAAVGGTFYVQGGEVFGTGGTVGQTVAYTPGGTNSCNPGTFQTYLSSDGGTVTTQLGGDRGACGEAGGCPAGYQRLCTSSGTLSSTCVRADACAAQVQQVSEGMSCTGLQRISFGEASKGSFVGCSGTKNCFCGNSTDPNSVVCFEDVGADSCGAAGLNQPTTYTQISSTQPPASLPPGETPPATPETPPFVCVSLSKDIDSPKFGQSVRFTCGTVSTATRYEFQYKVGNEVGTINPVTAGSNVTEPFAITKTGNYQAQCRPCTNAECAAWTEVW